MKLIEKIIRKKVKLPTGVEVKRVANLKINLPETVEEATQLIGENAVNWAAHGMLAHAKIVASNRLLGAAGDKKLKKSLRQFKESLRTMVDVMEMETTEAVSFLLGKDKFSAVKTHFDAVGAGAEQITVDFTSETLPQPKWFAADEEEEDEEDDDSAE